MLTLWFDPGLLTGVCAVDSVTGDVALLDEFDLLRTGQVLEPGIQLFQGPRPLIDGLHQVQVGWETYRIMKGPQTQAPYALEVIGMIKYLCMRNGYTILTEAAPAQRLICTPKMLKDIGWYEKVRGKKDAFSAAQHTISWWLRTDSLPNRYKSAIYGPLSE